MTILSRKLVFQVLRDPFGSFIRDLFKGDFCDILHLGGFKLGHLVQKLVGKIHVSTSMPHLLYMLLHVYRGTDMLTD